jgi:hypothetical protein
MLSKLRREKPSGEPKVGSTCMNKGHFNDMVIIRCNLCGSGSGYNSKEDGDDDRRGILDGLQGRAFYTVPCQHLVCVECALQQDSSYCPICSNTLGDGDVQELFVGLGSHTHTSKSLRRTILELALSGKHWTDVAMNANFLLQIVGEVTSLIQTQLFHEVSKSTFRHQEKQSLLLSHKSNINEMKLEMLARERETEKRSLELESRLVEAERQLSNMTLAYKEKMRKCDAWEQAYKHASGVNVDVGTSVQRSEWKSEPEKIPHLVTSPHSNYLRQRISQEGKYKSSKQPIKEATPSPQRQEQPVLTPLQLLAEAGKPQSTTNFYDMEIKNNSNDAVGQLSSFDLSKKRELNDSFYV